MEGCFYNKLRPIQTNRHAIWIMHSPSTFQTMMNEYFRDMITKGWLVIYIDDMLIYRADEKQMRERTKHVLQRLQENDLFLKLEKCKFIAKEVEFLGMIVKQGKIMMDPVKLAGISKWPEPKTVKQIQSFLGFVNFYRKFIGNYAEIVALLTELTKKTVPF